MQNTEDVLGAALAWREAGQAVVLATVVETWGSSPRPCGSQMAITASGHIAGSVSGGCVEAAVVEAAQAIFAGGTVQTLVFGISRDRAWDVGLPCGGKLTVFLEPVL